MLHRCSYWIKMEKAEFKTNFKPNERDGNSSKKGVKRLIEKKILSFYSQSQMHQGEQVDELHRKITVVFPSPNMSCPCKKMTISPSYSGHITSVFTWSFSIGQIYPNLGLFLKKNCFSWLSVLIQRFYETSSSCYLSDSLTQPWVPRILQHGGVCGESDLRQCTCIIG